MNRQHLGKRDEEIVRLYVEDGLTVKDVGALFGLTYVRVIQVLEAAGVDRRSRGWRSGWPWRDSEQRTKEIIAAYVEEELSLEEVGARFGLSPTCVRHVLIKASVARTSCGRRPAWRSKALARRNQEIIRLCLEEALKRKEVAARFDLRPETVSRILAKANLHRS
jgi:DNA-directed RNA polymerase specialized sigma subunit